MSSSLSHVGSAKNKPKARWWRDGGLDAAILVAGALAMNAIFLPTAFRESRSVNPTAAGQLGDFVGGYVGTGFALISVLLLVRTLRNQNRNAVREAFEAKYFTLLQLHRANVEEQQLGQAGGRKVFVMLIREWREIIPIVNRAAGEAGQQLTTPDVAAVAYTCLFFGTGPNSSRQLRAALAVFRLSFIDALVGLLDDENVKASVDPKRLGYRPFEGHQSRLGHYYRHLYQTICYVHQHVGVLTPTEAYGYAKTVRAQLSTHEQALLFLNSLTSFGASWWDGGHLLEYKLVKNIPDGFFDPTTEIDIRAWFPAGYFEEQSAPARHLMSSSNAPVA